MGKVSELLSEAWIERRIAECRSAVETNLGQDAWKEQLRQRLISDADADASAPSKTGGPPVRVALHWAALEHARGGSPETVRTICCGMTQAWLALVESLHFEPREYEFALTQPSKAKAMATTFQGEVRQEGRTFLVRYVARPQPFSLDMPYVWVCAALGGDRDRARRLARAYELHEPHQITAQYAIRDAALRHLLAEDDGRAEALCARLEDGYPPDAPPQRIEFPRGVIEKRPEALLEGIKKVSAKFKPMWDEKKYRQWHAKQIARRPSLTWDSVFEQTRSQLISAHWIVSLWAVAFLNVARWRGIDAVFANPKAFSEWVPMELCG